MSDKKTTFPFLLALGSSLACTPAATPEAPPPQAAPAKDCTDTSLPPESPEPLEPMAAHAAELEQRSNGGRVAQILDANGTVVETLAPEQFTQTLSVPDIENNSVDMIRQQVTGTDIVAARVDETTGRILVAVRGFIYAEVSTDLVFLLAPKDPHAERTPESIKPIHFDGPGAASAEPAPRPHLDVAKVSFESGGHHLVVETADASGGACRLVYGADGAPRSCSWSGGESRRCPQGTTAK